MKEVLIAKLTLDTFQRNKIMPLVVPKGDYGARVIQARIKDYGKPISVGINDAVSIVAERGDGENRAFSGRANDDGTVTVPITQWMVDVTNNDVVCHVVVTGDGYQYSTTSFLIQPQEKPNPTEISEEDPRVDLVTEIFANENARVSAENERIENENERKSSENERKSSEEERKNFYEEIKPLFNGVENFLTNQNIAQTLGNSKDKIMSQWAVNGVVNRMNKRITNLEQGEAPERFLTDSSVAYAKDVPENALPYAEISKIGGMTRKCMNLIPFPYRAISSTIAGITWTVNDDGSVTANGTATANSVLSLYYDKVVAPNGIIAGNTYTFSGSSSNVILACNIFVDGGEKAWMKNNNAYGGIYEDSYTGMYCYLVVLSGKTVNNQTVYPMLNEGSTALPYEPYFEGLRSAPVTEVESVGVNLFGGDVLANKLVEVAGATKDAKAGVVTFAAENVTGKEILTGFKAETQYTLIMYGKNTNEEQNGVNLKVVYEDGSTEFLYFTASGEESYCVYTTAINKSLTKIEGVRSSHSTALYYEKCGIFEGVLTAEDFKPYFRNTLPIPEAVQALDGFGWGINDEVYNYVDLEKQQFVKRVDCVDMGTFDWGTDTGMFKADLPSFFESRNVLIDRYVNVYGWEILLSTDKAIYSINNGASIFIHDSEYTDTTTFKAAMSGVMLYYELATPEITDISDLITVDNFIEVEGGGTLTFKNEYKYAIPSKVEYQVEV